MKTNKLKMLSIFAKVSEMEGLNHVSRFEFQTLKMSYGDKHTVTAFFRQPNWTYGAKDSSVILSEESVVISHMGEVSHLGGEEFEESLRLINCKTGENQDLSDEALKLIESWRRRLNKGRLLFSQQVREVKLFNKETWPELGIFQLAGNQKIWVCSKDGTATVFKDYSLPWESL